MTCPFRLLAIPPPDGPVPGDIVDRWLAAGAAGTIAALLRDPGRTPAEILAPGARLAALRRRCVAAGIPVLLATDVPTVVPPDLAGVHLRGDPDRATLGRAREHPGLLGRACHGEPQPGHDLVDYTLFAPVFAPGTPGPIAKHPAGLAALARWTGSGAAVEHAREHGSGGAGAAGLAVGVAAAAARGARRARSDAAVVAGATSARGSRNGLRRRART